MPDKEMTDKEKAEYDIRSTKISCLTFITVVVLCSVTIMFGLAANAWKENQSVVACSSGKVACEIRIWD